MKKIVYFIEWDTSGRSFDMHFPLMYFFESKLKWDVRYKCSFNLPSFLKEVPDLIILASTGGASRNLKILKWIFNSNIPVFSSYTEGMFRYDDLDQFLWGWNKKKVYLENLRMLWSFESYRMSLKVYPELKEKLRVSGAIGFDKYALLNFNKITEKKFKKVIGYGAYDFHGSLTSPKKDNIIQIYGSKEIEFIASQLLIVKKILKTLVNNNKDTLFIIKSHPGDQNRAPKEIEGLENYRNVKVISSPYEPISNIISKTDIWLSYNSTTIVDAWLLGIPTITFLKDESRMTSDAVKGSLIENNAAKIDLYIKEYYSFGFIENFTQLEKNRKRYINETIGFSDGLNHVRYMSFLKPFIKKINNLEMIKGSWNISYKDKLKEYFKTLIYTISKGKYNTPILKRWALVFDRFKIEEVSKFKKNKYSDIENFYKTNQKKIEDLYLNFDHKFETYKNSKIRE